MSGQDDNVKSRLRPWSAERQKPSLRSACLRPGCEKLDGRVTFVRARGESAMRIRVLIADDHTVVRQGLRMFLSDADLEIVGEARDGREAVDLARRLMPDVVLMDLLMPNMDGIAATAAIRRFGVLEQVAEAPQLQQAIRSAAAGQVLLSPKVAAR